MFLCGAALILASGTTGCKREDSDRSNQAIAAMNKGVSLMGQYQYEGAVAAFEEVLRVRPDLEQARLNMAVALFNRNQKEDLEASQVLLNELLKRNPQNVGALYFKAILLQHAGKAEQAVPLLETVLRQRPEDGACWYILGLCKLRTGQPSEAEFLKAVQYRPHLFSAYYQLYQAALRQDAPEHAKQYLEKFKMLRESPLGESIELPQYNQMGDLAMALPVPARPGASVTRSRFELGRARTVAKCNAPGDLPLSAAMVDIDANGLMDVVLCVGGTVQILSQKKAGQFESRFLEGNPADVTAVALGDFNNDGLPDLAAAAGTRVELWQQFPAGFTNVTERAMGTGQSAATCLFMDADHDGDLDLIAGGDDLRIWNNKGDGSFTNSVELKLAAGARAIGASFADLDGDRDADLVVMSFEQPPMVFANELLGTFAEGKTISGDVARAGILDFFNEDGIPDLMLLTTNRQRPFQLCIGDGRGAFRASPTVVGGMGDGKHITAFRAADLDLDGDLDMVCVGEGVEALLNDGEGRFVRGGKLLPPGTAMRFVECADITGDLVPDLLAVSTGDTNHLMVFPGSLTPPSTAMAIHPTGVRSRDGRTRSPATAYGVKLTVRAGLKEVSRLFTGRNGGPSQSSAPVIIGLDGTGKADYAAIAWPDGITQVEIGLPAGQTHTISELQRKVSSCPVLFSWNGRRFEFVTDFAGVGGLGYFAAPGVYAPPQVLEHVKIESSQLQVSNGCYELRITEPMEESAYVDRLELLAIDHPATWKVFPDERLAISGPAPTHDLLVVSKPVFPQRAIDPSGNECADRLKRVDRVYAYSPPLDRRYIGFCKRHTLELDFGTALQGFAGEGRVFLFIHGFIEYPYSQTVYAASQSRLAWEPIRVEREEPDGGWTTIVDDAGAPGGMARMMTVDLTKLITPRTRKLRLTTNLEVFYDQVFVSSDEGKAKVQIRTAKLLQADLRKVGFAREFSPDGNLPLIYDYDLTDATAPFHVLKGSYTGYGDVKTLLVDFDDRYAIVGPGDEIAARFDAAELPPPPRGETRSFILVSHAYCKDMDLYTGTPRTLEPLPFRGMSRYPYVAPERYPATPQHQVFLRQWNTRVVD